MCTFDFGCEVTSFSVVGDESLGLGDVGLLVVSCSAMLAAFGGAEAIRNVCKGVAIVLRARLSSDILVI